MTVDDHLEQERAPEAPASGGFLPPPDDDWAEEEVLLPPRRRWLSPLTLALVAALAATAGLIGGIELEKGRGGGNSNSRSSPLAVLASGSQASSLTSARAQGFSGEGSFNSGLTTGQVSFIRGSSLYLTDTSGSTVRVDTSASTSYTASKKTTLRGISPGDQVTVIGQRGQNGVVRANRIQVGDSPVGLAAGGVRPNAQSGGAPSDSTPSGSTPSGSTPSGSGSSGQRPALSSTLRDCLKKQGVTLPTGRPGTGPSGGAGSAGGRFGGPGGAPSAALQKAFQACRKYLPSTSGTPTDGFSG